MSNPLIHAGVQDPRWPLLRTELMSVTGRPRANPLQLSRRHTRLWLVIGTWLTHAGSAVLRWHGRVNMRRELIALDDQVLSDIGLRRAQVEAEWHKPFWRA